ncbi:hypothetical protein [Paraburkholderia heleia]|uniref:hypothetical protein n=1 Tax=Paraburkholderia heleia TaxID=634127 RepID=UPI0012ED27B0|nr:hypothetical protein [Paraburkholderia heleia]
MLRNRLESVRNSNANDSHLQQKDETTRKFVKSLCLDAQFLALAALLCVSGGSATRKARTDRQKKAAPEGAANKETEKQS